MRYSLFLAAKLLLFFVNTNELLKKLFARARKLSHEEDGTSVVVLNHIDEGMVAMEIHTAGFIRAYGGEFHHSHGHGSRLGSLFAHLNLGLLKHLRHIHIATGKGREVGA